MLSRLSRSHMIVVMVKMETGKIGTALRAWVRWGG